MKRKDAPKPAFEPEWQPLATSRPKRQKVRESVAAPNGATPSSSSRIGSKRTKKEHPAPIANTDIEPQDLVYSFSSLPSDVWRHILRIAELSHSQLLELRSVCRYFDARVVGLFVTELDDYILQDMTRVKLPDFSNLVRNWRYPDAIRSLRLVNFKHPWHSKESLKRAISKFTSLRSLTLSGEALNDVSFQVLVRGAPPTLTCLELDFTPNALTAAPAGSSKSLTSLKNLKIHVSTSSSGTSADAASDDLKMAQFVGSCVREWTELESLTVELRTSAGTAALLQTIEEKERDVGCSLRSLSIIGQFDWNDVNRVLTTLRDLHDLKLISLDDSASSRSIPLPSLPPALSDTGGDVYASPLMPLSPSSNSNDGAPTPNQPSSVGASSAMPGAADAITIDAFRLIHPSISSLVIGGVPRPLASLTLLTPALKQLTLVPPMTVTVLDISQCSLINSLSFEAAPSLTPANFYTSSGANSLVPLGTACVGSNILQPITPSQSVHSVTSDVARFHIHRIEWASSSLGPSSNLQSLSFHHFKFQSQVSFNLPNLTNLDVSGVGKYQPYFDGSLPTLSVACHSLKRLRVDLNDSTGFDVSSFDSDTLNVSELILEDVYLGNRSTAERRQGSDQSLQFIHKKSIPLYLLHSLNSQFPELRKLVLRFLPVNLYLTSMEALSHDKVQSLCLENLPLNDLDVPHLEALSYGVQILDRTTLIDSFNLPGKFQFLTSLNLYASSALPDVVYRELSIPTLRDLELNLPILPLHISCPKLKILRLGVKSQGAARFLAASLPVLPELDHLEVLCATSTDGELEDDNSEEEEFYINERKRSRQQPPVAQQHGAQQHYHVASPAAVEQTGPEILDIRHEKLRVLRFQGLLVGMVKFILPNLEELVMRQSRGLVVSEIQLPKLKILTLAEPSLKDTFVSSCGASLRRVIVLRDPKVSTRSQLKRN